MARQRVFTKEELLEATARLLLETGYEGFQIKALSSMLPGARSTIYDYFANKEELVAACMRQYMDRTLQACKSVSMSDPVESMKAMMNIFIEQANFHKLIQSVPHHTRLTSEQAIRDLTFVEEGHDELKTMLLELFEKAQKEGRLRKDIPSPLMASVFFHAIDTPNWMNIPAPQWAEILFSIWWNGSSSQNC